MIGWGFLDTFLKYRFLEKMLGAKRRFSYLWFYLGSLIYGQMNVRFHLAGTARGNLIYLCGCAFVLNLLLFYGSLVKKAFFTLWVYCAQGVSADVLLIICHALAVSNGQVRCSDTMLNAIGMIACLAQYLMMEILQRRLYILKRDFGDRDIFYLMPVILFIYASVSMIRTMFIGINDWTSEDLLITAVLCSLIAIVGGTLHVYCIVKLEARLLERLAKQEYQMLERHMETVGEQYRQTRKAWHDMKNHGLCLAQLLAEGKVDEASCYLKQLDIRIEEGKPAVQTGSVFADALLNPKYQQACEMGIDISISMAVPKEEQIAPVDICCLLANALDNAIEACEREGRESAGWIRMKARMYAGYWMLEVRNSIHSPVRMKNGRLLSSKRIETGGVGLQNMKAVVERYGGVMDIQNDSCFTLSVMLPLPSAAEKKPPAP